LAQDNKLIRSLIESSRNGNINAFEQLFRMHVGYVYAISFRLLADSNEANENTSDIFVEAWKTISMVRRDSPFILWLKAIAIYSSLQKIRGREKNATENRPRPSRKGLDFVDQELLSLPESERIVFVLNDIEHYKNEEISDLLSLSKDEVEHFLNRARATIMDSLVLKTNEALDRALKQIPESIEPLEDLYNRFINSISQINSPDNKEISETEKNSDNKNNNSKEEIKSFSFKNLFKKKNS
jgi:RNA polymerase sigma-70 factor, ECF subfamily